VSSMRRSSEVSSPHGKATQHTADLYLTAKNGSRRAVSVEGGVTGLGADIIIVDDLLKAADANSPTERQKAQDFYVNTLISRLNDKNTGRIIVVQQRLHEDDLAGYLIAKGGFKHLNLPAIAETAQTYDLGVYGVKARETGELLFEARESQAILDQVRAEMGRGAFAAQYQQNPQASDDQIIRWDKLHFYQGDVPRNECIYLVQSWDTATSDAPTANFSVCTTWGHHQGVWKLLDVYRERLNFTDLVSKAVALRDKWRPDRVLIEDASSGRALLQTLRSEKYRGASSPASVVVTSMTPSLSKETRLSAGALLLEDGRVQLPIDAPWLEVLRRELLAFPGGKLDDQVDSVSQFLKYAAGPRSNARLDRARGHTR
jgi:predicted phage terminase large subunit-like protein